MKHVSPLLGYNNNVRHKNRIFHIQTEDSGIKHPHIITHLFMDGGRILKSVKRSYAEHVGADKMQDIVKGLMKEQHKAMFIALRDGQFDHLLGDDGKSGKDVAKDAKAKDAAAKEKEAAKEAPAPAKKASLKPPPPPAPAAPGPDDEDMVPMTTRTPELSIDIDTLEGAAKSQGGGVKQASDMPPPNQNMFREKPTSGGYRNASPAPEATNVKPRSNPPNKKPPSTPPLNKKPASAPPKKPATPSDPRYAAARPAAIFGQTRPQQGSSIFGEDLISDKSLDEVILSYLAEDLEPSKK